MNKCAPRFILSVADQPCGRCGIELVSALRLGLIDVGLEDAAARLALAGVHGSLRGIRILRRGYTFTDGSDGQGHLDAGLFFLAFMRDIHRQFVPMQRALAKADGLNEYIEHTGSAVFACPPGLAPDDDWGSQLFA